MLSASSCRRAPDDGTLRSAVHLGKERVLDEDVGFGIRQLVDIAERALSPGINDPSTAVQAIERCSGHDGTYAVKTEYAAVSRKIARPVARQVDNAEAQHFTSDCPMAAEQIAAVAQSGAKPTHPIQLLRKAYGI